MECLKNMSFLLPLEAEAEVDILTFLLGEGVLAVKKSSKMLMVLEEKFKIKRGC
jgi:hypothetical protein